MIFWKGRVFLFFLYLFKVLQVFLEAFYISPLEHPSPQFITKCLHYSSSLLHIHCIAKSNYRRASYFYHLHSLVSLQCSSPRKRGAYAQRKGVLGSNLGPKAILKLNSNSKSRWNALIQNRCNSWLPDKCRAINQRCWLSARVEMCYFSKKGILPFFLLCNVNIKRADTFSRVIIIPGSKGIIRHFKLISTNC